MATLLRLILTVALVAPAAAHAARSDWVAADAAKMRLLLAGRDEKGVAGGIELVLKPGWHTYWRNPGEVGVPPVFDFSGSTNVANVEVLYPAPVRYGEEGAGVSLVYLDEVVFPLLIEPIKADEPVTLRAEAVFGVCREVCIPTRANAVATLLPDAERDALSETRLKRFTARLPKEAEPGRFAVEAVTAEADALIIDMRMPDSSYMDLFAIPPEGWYIGQPTFVSRADGVSRYRLPLAGKPKDVSVKGQTFEFVGVAGGEVIRQEVAIR